ncbi:MAG: hypothetical protein NTZ09_10705 [Candidatus Hydrogenedentes bacterium]|nr:hypothetical protein [Candidatus Hydrogenedentota bacterium]
MKYEDASSPGGRRKKTGVLRFSRRSRGQFLRANLARRMRRQNNSTEDLQECERISRRLLDPLTAKFVSIMRRAFLSAIKFG